MGMKMAYKIYNFDDDFNDVNMVFAHKDNKEKYETLKEHLSLTLKYYKRLEKEKAIDKVVNNAINSLTINDKKLDQNMRLLIKDMFVNAIYLHDIGKINPYFQRNKMINPRFDIIDYQDKGDSSHSLLSSLIYLDYFLNIIDTVKGKEKVTFLYNVLFSFAYSISRHHSNLKDLEVFLDKLEGLYSRVKRNPKILYGYKFKAIKGKDFFKNNVFRIRHQLQKKIWKYDSIEYYILNKLLFSLIISCDFYATYEFMSKQSVDNFGIIDDIEDFIELYRNTPIYKGIKSYKKNKGHFDNNPINSIRSDLFLEAENNLNLAIDKNIFYLEAPTGSGKTNISINVALNLIENYQEINKIFYIFPFNTLVEQTRESITEIFGDGTKKNQTVAVINSITPILTEEEKIENDEIINWEKHLLNRQLLHYPIILTTHINFFNYIFGTGREVNLPIVHLCNSIIIIDEIQSYKNKIWTEIIMFLEKFSNLLNMKIVIMSATLPKLDLLLSESPKIFADLIKNKSKYYNSPFFKNRVNLNYDLLDKGEIDEEILLSKIKGVLEKRKEARVLIEFISKNRARNFYNLLAKEMPDKRIEEITGDDNKYFRKRLFAELKETNDKGEESLKDIIIVATQVIEAGVDIDMDIGFKDISLLDNEEQFLGRINRSCKKADAVAYFFHMDDARKIYKGDFRLEKDLRDEEYRKHLNNKTFSEFYSKVFKSLNEEKHSFTKNNIKNRLEEAAMLRYIDVEKNMRLIDQKQYHIYIPYYLKDSQGEKLINGKKLWDEYKTLILDNTFGYAEKKIKLSYLYSKMNNFIFDLFKRPPAYTEEFGDIYYFEEGTSFIDDNGKFDRSKYLSEFGGPFL